MPSLCAVKNLKGKVSRLLDIIIRRIRMPITGDFSRDVNVITDSIDVCGFTCKPRIKRFSLLVTWLHRYFLGKGGSSSFGADGLAGVPAGSLSGRAQAAGSIVIDNARNA